MTRIADHFAQLRSRRAVALIPFVTAGDPDLETTAQALLTLDQQGADFLEVGVPYSDPLADGPVIQAAATRSLARGTTLNAVLEMLRQITPQLQSPVILFTYYNPILAVGPEVFLDRLQACGVSGMVIPDLPIEEGETLRKLAQDRALEIIWLAAPTSPQTRLQHLAAVASGFIYLVSTTGVTGMRTQVADSVKTSIENLRSLTTLPIAVGFGISTPDQARQVAQWGADGVIVGSAFVKLLQEKSAEERLTALGHFCRALKDALSV
jgi:tryptophan synthase alpha chain